MTEEYDSPKTYIKEVKSINSLTDVDKIYAGRVLSFHIILLN